jgi:redox-sensitive bicupin YhaK (pirin superfamily)
MKVVVSLFLFFLPLFEVAAQTCKTSIALKVKDVKKSKVDYPTGDKKFSVLEAFPSPFNAVEEVDPFLICHEWGKSQKKIGVPAIDPGKAKEKQEKHVGWHPHRGFDIVSYVKEGRGSHADSLGNVAVVRSGGIQWMRTASGIEHAEGGGNPKSANKHGFQLWINLPSHLKMSKPSYGKC